jgi:hypothetical protein
LSGWRAPRRRSERRLDVRVFCPRHWQDGGPTGHCSYAALIAGYLGSARLMDDAVTEFAVDYADQNQRDRYSKTTDPGSGFSAGEIRNSTS